MPTATDSAGGNADPAAAQVPPEQPALRGLLDALLTGSDLGQLVAAAGRGGQLVEGPAAAHPVVAAALAAETERGGAGSQVLAATPTERAAEELVEQLREMLDPAAVVHFPSWETLPHERLSPRADTVGTRLQVLRSLRTDAEPSPRVVVTSVRSLIQPLAPGLGERVPVELRPGMEVDFAEVVEQLVSLAYTRVDLVEKRGEFAVRGGILDVFPPTAEHPVRAEFWGDEVAELREFSVADQRSLPTAEAQPPAVVRATACRELLLTDEVRARAEELAASVQGTGDPQLAEMLGKLAGGVFSEGIEALIPALLPGRMRLLPEYLSAGAHVVLLDPEKASTRAHDLVRTGQEFLEASWMAAAGGGSAPADLGQFDMGASAYRSLDQVRESAQQAGCCWWAVSQMSSDSELPTIERGSDAALRLGIEHGSRYHGDITRAAEDLRQHTASGGAAVMLVAGSGTAARAVEQLGEADVPALVSSELAHAPSPGRVQVLRGALEEGFRAPEIGLVVLTEADVTGGRHGTSGEAIRQRKGRPARRRGAVDPLSLQPGDYVVHDKHGIGRYVEMVERSAQGATREYLVVEYASSKRGQPGDRLFIPTDQLSQLSRYVGGEAPTVNKLGGSDWARTKSKARKAVKEIAAELVQLYAARQASPGHAFGPDTPWQAEMEDAFPFVETPDQLSAIDEVKRDMTLPVPMDRVVAGDVGYGKTEIAVRAAFKAVADGKQVAVLVPTTLLAEQHLQTFTERMRSFPVTIRGMSRFTDPSAVETVTSGLADGEVDIVVGTHRLLQSGMRWKDLGLIIVDEEQRFGVDHKEHIKSLRTHVDVLTMSATPIPRTLEMGLAGIREMSQILTPPEERHPVLTYVGAFDDKQVAAAIHRELLRDGQVFFVHNRVSDIDATAAHLRELVPEARVVTAHGQMNEVTLERTVADFWHRESDVLVCTTIVETGLDISNANTLIVDRADRLGLAQLHQLRGRVGRSRERGYAYFLYPGQTQLTETAYDRLATIAQNSELGAGMAVAMKDLEIRGAGNILGGEQSGHIAGVGFDLYVRLVGEAVAAFRQHAGEHGDGEQAEPEEVRVELPVDAHIPHDYVDGERLRLEAYRKIASVADAEGIDAVRHELADRYGEPPTPVENLLAVAGFRQLCRRAGVSEVAGQGSTIRFSPVQLADSDLVRLRRLAPKAVHKPAMGLVSVPRPTEGAPTGTFGPGRMGSAPLRDVALLHWCGEFIRRVLLGEQ